MLLLEVRGRLLLPLVLELVRVVLLQTLQLYRVQVCGAVDLGVVRGVGGGVELPVRGLLLARLVRVHLLLLRFIVDDVGGEAVVLLNQLFQVQLLIC